MDCIHNQQDTITVYHQYIGNIIIPAENGELASGLSGEGRMAEPENIIAFLENDLKKYNAKKSAEML